MKETIADYIVPITQDGNNVMFDFLRATELIRCKNCIHHHGYNCDRLYGFQDAFTFMDEDYCSQAERRGEDAKRES